MWPVLLRRSTALDRVEKAPVKWGGQFWPQPASAGPRCCPTRPATFRLPRFFTRFRGPQALCKRLRWLDAATSLTDLGAIRGNRLEALKRDRAGQHSIRINDRWRICFCWRDGNACDGEIVDYH